MNPRRVLEEDPLRARTTLFAWVVEKVSTLKVTAWKVALAVEAVGGGGTAAAAAEAPPPWSSSASCRLLLLPRVEDALNTAPAASMAAMPLSTLGWVFPREFCSAESLKARTTPLPSPAPLPMVTMEAMNTWSTTLPGTNGVSTQVNTPPLSALITPGESTSTPVSVPSVNTPRVNSRPGASTASVTLTIPRLGVVEGVEEEEGVVDTGGVWEGVGVWEEVAVGGEVCTWVKVGALEGFGAGVGGGEGVGGALGNKAVTPLDWLGLGV